MSVKYKIVFVLALIAMLSTSAILGVFFYHDKEFQEDAKVRMGDYALLLNDLIDRNLFERYGDVQAFGKNTSAYEPANWRNPSDSNPLIASINAYMTNYGIYQISMLLDTKGNVLAVNTVNAKGKPLDTAALYNQNFANREWFKNPLNGKFLEGKNGLTGTAVTGP